MIAMLYLAIIFPAIWADIILLSVVIAAFYFLYRSRIIRIQKQKDLLESQVKQRTIEIIKQKEQVEKQKRMLEEEKTKTEKLLL